MRHTLLPVFILTAGMLGAQDTHSVAKITRIQTLPDGKVRAYVSILDPDGIPLADLTALRLTLLENGRQVYSEQLSSRWQVSSVLAIDLSGSMARILPAAKTSAMRLVEESPLGVEFAVIGFDSEPTVRAPFDTRKAAIRLAIARLELRRPRAPTALNDAIWEAVEMLRTREGVRDVLALTDGIDNASKHKPADVVAHANEYQVRVSTIGVGPGARPEPLRALLANGGRYTGADQASQLGAMFESHARFLSSEYMVEYKSDRPADGSRREVIARVEARRQGGGAEQSEVTSRYVAPRFIPAVSGRLAPYSIALAVLLLAPGLISTVWAMKSIRGNRARVVSKLPPDSKMIGALDSSGIAFAGGQPVVRCPAEGCGRPHHIRSWRLQRCRCARDNTRLEVCYHRTWPTWVRRTLDWVSAGYSPAAGRKWLCTCAGDKEGY